MSDSGSYLGLTLTLPKLHSVFFIGQTTSEDHLIEIV